MYNYLIDTHCDTAYEIYKRNENLTQNTCHISLEKAKVFDKYAQFFAIWSDKKKSDEQAFEDFLKIRDDFKNQISNNSLGVRFVTSFDGMNSAWNENKAAAFLAVEDARILANNLDRLDILHQSGVKYLTLMWGGSTCIGGSHNVDGGLTPFGKAVVEKCFDIGIVPDISHANYDTASDVIELAYKHNKPIIASHSNSYSLYPHTRNLRDEHVHAIVELGGIIGVSLCPYHLTDTNKKVCDVSDVVDHIIKYISLGAENNIGLGCDLDGTELPSGFNSIADLKLISNELSQRGISDSVIDKILYENYYNFIKNNFN